MASPDPSLSSLPLLRMGEHLHGHLGWLAAIALVHPALLLRNRARRAHLSVVLAAAGATLVGAIGVSLYPAYSDRLRQPIFAEAPGIGYLFERKEHLAFGAILLTWAGAASYAGSFRSQGPVRDSLRRAAHASFVAAALLAIATAAMGTLVSTCRTF